MSSRNESVAMDYDKLVFLNVDVRHWFPENSILSISTSCRLAWQVASDMLLD